MIKAKETEEFRDLLGAHYSKTIVAHLRNKGLEVPKPHYLRKVFTGKLEAPEIEVAIWEVVIEAKKNADKLSHLKNQYKSI